MRLPWTSAFWVWRAGRGLGYHAGRSFREGDCYLRARRFAFGFAIFLSAFLLFQVQPMIARFILPWFGGTPATWTACMLFFQALLLGGYIYAHVLSTRVPPARQAIVHGLLLLAAVACLPIIPTPPPDPGDPQSPVWRIVRILAVSVGLPYFALSATSPLVQKWFSDVESGRPYRLYALSNVGSLLALLTYPVLVEPTLRLPVQAYVWSVGFVLFALVCWLTALSVSRSLQRSDGGAAPAQDGQAGAAENLPRAKPATRPRLRDMGFWLLLSACGSLLLLAGTNQISQDVAVVPLLWIVPLALYLLTFILCFHSDRWYPRWLFGPLYLVAALFCVYGLERGVDLGVMRQILVYGGAVFVCCMICHGELARVKPHPRYLTLFYLIMATGGVLGGILVAVVAPLVFDRLLEFQIGLLGCGFLMLIAYHRDPASALNRGRPHWAWALLRVGFGVLTAVIVLEVRGYTLERAGEKEKNFLGWRIDPQRIAILARSRNFYGTLTVKTAQWDLGPYRTLHHGRIVHGQQYMQDAAHLLGLTYYGRNSGVAAALTEHPRRKAADPKAQTLAIGAIGLGVGTITTYGHTGDTICIYEINPDVVRMARKYFTYLKDTPAKVDLVMGDARLSMERELKEGRARKFDVLIVDAFIGDAIPMHLLTRECFGLYWQHMKRDGVLAVHISNRYLDLKPIVHALSRELGLQVLWVNTSGHEATGTNRASWLLVTRNNEFVETLSREEDCLDITESQERDVVWTDDYGSLFSVLTGDD